MPLTSSDSWAERWFGSVYYPILYQNRSESEAFSFIERLYNQLDLPPKASVLDLACGRGRHAIKMAQLGWNVEGWDISPQSILEASMHENSFLKFSVWDMRDPFPPRAFHAIFNLFTSFGYFDRTQENQTVLQHIAHALLPKGILVLDYMNVPYVLENLVPKEEKIIDHVHFSLRREYDGTFIHKYIDVNDGGKAFAFREQVQAIMPNHFEELIQSVGLKPLKIWGDYEGNPYQKNSPRYLIFGQKQ